jgi:filamentous hemagglutinin
MAAISNGIVKIFNEAMPSFGRGDDDNTQSNNDIKELAYDTDSMQVNSSTATNVASNITSANDLNITSQNNNLISGSNLDSGNDININSTSGTTIITSAQDQSSTSTETVNQSYNDFSADYERGRISANSNSKVLEANSATTTTTQVSSNLSAANNINITSDEHLNILSSNLTTNSGNVSLTSNNGNVNILALEDTTSTASQIKEGTLTLSAGIGNAHVDTAYAQYDLIEAARNVADAKKQLNHMETLYKNGEADADAVSDAKTNLAISMANLTLARLKLAASAAKSAGSVESIWTGFYGDLRLSVAGFKTNSTTNSSTAVASNILSNGNLTINSGMGGLSSSDSGNTTITGSSLKSQVSDIEITSRNNTIINASKDTYSQGATTKAWNESITLATTNSGGAGTAIDNAVNAASIALGAGMSRSKLDTNSTTYNNSSLTADSGTIKINTLNNATLKGTNLLAQDIILNTAGNLTVASLQDSFQQKGSRS